MSDKIQEHIQHYGWHCLHVFPTEPGQERFTYTIGFAEASGAPEIMVFNLSREKAHPLLSECAMLLQSGAVIECNVEDDRILSGGYKVVFKPVKPAAFGEYLGTARRYYGDAAFLAAVMFLPDRSHKFPWEAGYDGISANESLSIV